MEGSLFSAYPWTRISMMSKQWLIKWWHFIRIPSKAFWEVQILDSIHGDHDSMDLRWGLWISQDSLNCKWQKPNSNWLKERKKKGNLLAHVSEEPREINFRHSWIQVVTTCLEVCLPVCLSFQVMVCLCTGFILSQQFQPDSYQPKASEKESISSPTALPRSWGCHSSQAVTLG